MGARGSLQTYPPQDRPLPTLKELRPFLFYKASHESALTPFWGPPQGAWTRHKAAADGKARQGQRRQLKLMRRGYGQGWARNRQVGAKGLKPGRQGQGTQAVNSLGWREASGQLGLGRAPRKQGRRGPGTKLVCGQLVLARRGQGDRARARDPTMCADSWGLG